MDRTRIFAFHLKPEDNRIVRLTIRSSGPADAVPGFKDLLVRQIRPRLVETHRAFHELVEAGSVFRGLDMR